MTKESFLKQLASLIAKTHVDTEVNELLRKAFNRACEDELQFKNETPNEYDEIIKRTFDVNRISTKRVTATELCELVGLPKNHANVSGIAKALRSATGRDSFRSHGVMYNLLPFFRDGTIG